MKLTHGKSNSERTKIVVIVSAATALLGTAPLAALAGAPSSSTGKTDTGVRKLIAAPAPHGACQVIASVDGDLSPAQTAQMNALGADVTRHLGFIHSVAMTLPTRNLGKLAALPFVKHLSYDGIVKKYDEFTMASSGAGSTYQSYGLTGKGIGVAIIDSGVRTSTDLTDPITRQSRLKAQQTFVGGNYTYDDLCGHGTHVAGIVGGNGARSTGVAAGGVAYTHTFYGIARNVSIINARVLDGNGLGSVSNVLSGLQWVVANKGTYNIKVINLSLGHPITESYTTDPLCKAVEAAWKAGIVVVCAAGNNGRLSGATSTPGRDNEGWGTAYGSIQSPANDPYVITVGATKAMSANRGDDRIATYSSRGPSRLDLMLKPDIIAPGNKVVSLYSFDSSLYQWNTANNNGLPMSSYQNIPVTMASTDYFVLSGTSMAAPVVAGAAALMLEKDSSLSPDTIKARLMVSADKWLDPNGIADPLTYGAGYLDIPAAIASTITLLPGQYALSPQLVNANGTISVSTSVIGSTNIWGSKAVTGVSAVYGSKAVTGVNTVFSSKAVTGVSTVSGSKAVTGVSTVFASGVWGDKNSYGTFGGDSVDLSSVVMKGE